MGEGLLLLMFVVGLALVFDYINGFHDTANAIATVVSTNVLPPRTAVLMAGLFNFVGAFMGTGVAKTIGGDIVDPATITQTVIAAALVGAIVWNLITWYFGIPSSSSHALVGGLCGAVIMHRLFAVGFSGPIMDVFVHRPDKPNGVVTTVKFLVLSPLFGLLSGFFIMVILTWIVKPFAPTKVNKSFKALQLISSGSMALSHGSNDAQKAMGIVTMACLSYYKLQQNGVLPDWLALDAKGQAEVPLWVKAACATAIGLGTAAGGWRIMKTMGHKIIKLKPIHGFAAETAGAAVIQVATHWFHAPVSTTHVISSSIMGVGASKRISAVRWGIAGNIFVAWVLTIPVSCLVAMICYVVLRPLLGP
ncbi:MAG: anion permease [Planctomycetota bacterium]